jgi:hypothetical protein
MGICHGLTAVEMQPTAAALPDTVDGHAGPQYSSAPPGGALLY